MNAKELQLGLLLLKEGHLTKDQLKKALIKQGEIRRFGRHQRLGEVIVKLGLLTQPQIDACADMQERISAPGAQHTPLGMLMIERGFASPSKIYETLVEQQFAEGMFGEIMLEKGFLTREQLEEMLAYQEAERTGVKAP